jgi:hypothetical protein
MKYIMFKNDHGEAFPFLFDDLVTHSEFRPYAERALLIEGICAEIVSAGFVRLCPTGIEAVGKSISLSLESREEDTDIIEMHMLSTQSLSAKIPY